MRVNQQEKNILGAKRSLKLDLKLHSDFEGHCVAICRNNLLTLGAKTISQLKGLCMDTVSVNSAVHQLQPKINI